MPRSGAYKCGQGRGSRRRGPRFSGKPRRRVSSGSQASPAVSQPSRTWVEISAATRSRNGASASPSTASSPTTRALVGHRHRRSRSPRLRPRPPGRGRARRLPGTGFPPRRSAGSRTSSAHNPAQDVVRVFTEVEDPLDRRPAPARSLVADPPLELPHRRAHRCRAPEGPPAPEVDQHQGLRAGDHQLVVRQPVGRSLVGDARPADSADADEALEQVVEAGRRVVLDARARASRTRLPRPRASRDGGGTRCGRGRSRAGSGRSRRRPGRRCPRTRRASARSS